MRSYLKKEKEKINPAVLTADELITRKLKSGRNSHGTKLKVTLSFCVVVSVLAGLSMLWKNVNGMQPDTEGVFELASAPISAATSKRDLISIPSGTVKANPFLPYRDIGGSNIVNDVPKFDLVAPPEAINENSDAARVMDTIVSGILYDKYSPSAILNIEGNDYLVKKGDVVNNYKILNIMQDSVTVKLGNNTYKAGIGEILTGGTVNYNEVSNLNKKFGGERR